MQTDNPNLVATGLDLAPTADPKPEAPAEPTPIQAESPTPEPVASPPPLVQSQPDDAAERAAIKAAAAAEERASVQGQQNPTGETAREAYLRMKAEQDERDRADNERAKAEFTRKVLEARKPVEPEYKPQPVAPSVLDQTRREMEEGAKQNLRHAEFHAVHPMPRGHNPEPGSSTPVFRPEDYVPNMNQGGSKQPV